MAAVGSAEWVAQQTYNPRTAADNAAWQADPRSNPNNTMGVYYDPSNAKGDVSGYYYDFNNPALRVNQGGQASSMGAAGITPGSSGDPTWNPAAYATQSYGGQGQGGLVPLANQLTNANASQGSATPAGYSGGLGSGSIGGQHGPSQASGGDPWQTANASYGNATPAGYSGGVGSGSQGASGSVLNGWGGSQSGAPQTANASYGSATPAGYSGGLSTDGQAGAAAGKAYQSSSMFGGGQQAGGSYGGGGSQGGQIPGYGGAQQAYGGGGASNPYGAAPPPAYAPTASSYSPTAPGNPGQLQNNTWWGDPAQASLENAFGQYGQNFLNPTNTQQLNASNPFAQPLQGEALGRNAGAMYGNTTNSQNALGALTSQLGQPSELAQNSGGIAGKIGQADNSQGYLQQIGQQLGGPGALEQFAASSLTGDNPYYARLAKQGRDAINQEAIARGAYGADGTLAALGNYQSGMDAQNYQAQAQLQQAAQAAQQARLGLGGSLSQAADSSALNQGNALSSLYQNMFGDRMQAAGLGIQGNSAADQSQIARLAGLTNMVNNGDQTTLARLSGQAGLANQADTQGLNSLNSYFNQAGNAQQAGGQRINSQLDRALQEAMAQAGLYGGFYGQGGSQSVDAGTAGANAGANAAQLTGQGQNSGVNNLINIFSALMGGGSKK